MTSLYMVVNIIYIPHIQYRRFWLDQNDETEALQALPGERTHQSLTFMASNCDDRTSLRWDGWSRDSRLASAISRRTFIHPSSGILIAFTSLQYPTRNRTRWILATRSYASASMLCSNTAVFPQLSCSIMEHPSGLDTEIGARRMLKAELC